MGKTFTIENRWLGQAEKYKVGVHRFRLFGLTVFKWEEFL